MIGTSGSHWHEAKKKITNSKRKRKRELHDICEGEC